MLKLACLVLTFAGSFGVRAYSGPAPEPPERYPNGALRIAVRAKLRELRFLSPLSYRGGFLTKSLVYETLVRRGADGRLEPGLARSWSIGEHGRRISLLLHPEARWHDGKPVRAHDIAVHFRRWLHLPEHSWLRSCRKIEAVHAPGAHELILELSEPAAVLAELCAINPAAIRGPGALDREGEFVHPVGSGPWRVVSKNPSGYVYERVRDRMQILLVPFEHRPASAAARWIRDGRLDAFVSGWSEETPIELLQEVEKDPGLRMTFGPGSSVQYMSFHLEEGPTKDVGVRRAIRDAIRPERMIEKLEFGHAERCHGWAAPGVALWPEAERVPTASAEPDGDLRGTRLRILDTTGQGRASRIAGAAARQLRARGFEVERIRLPEADYARRVREGGWDLRVESTWGVPYDPYLSLVARFSPPTVDPSAARHRYVGVDRELESLVAGIRRRTAEADRVKGYVEVQECLDRKVLIIPLYAPRRFAIHRAGLSGIELPLDGYRVELGGLRRHRRL